MPEQPIESGSSPVLGPLDQFAEVAGGIGEVAIFGAILGGLTGQAIGGGVGALACALRFGGPSPPLWEDLLFAVLPAAVMGGATGAVLLSVVYGLFLGMLMGLEFLARWFTRLGLRVLRRAR